MLGVICALAEVIHTGAATEPDFTELSLEELGAIQVPIVSVASKYDQSAAEAPASVSVVTAEEIRQFGYRSLAEVLRSVRGLYVSYDRAYHYLGVRGFSSPGDYGSRVLLLIDGHRLNEPIYDSAFLGNDFPLDVEMIERVEVLRGPALALYGNNAFLAVINVVTRQGSDLAGGELSGAVGSLESYHARFSYGRRVGDELDFALSGSVVDRRGYSSLYYPEYAGIDGGVADDLDDLSSLKYLASLRYRDWTLSGIWGIRTKSIPTGAYGTIFDDPRHEVTDQRGYLDLKYQHTFGEDWDVTGRVFVDAYDYCGHYPYPADDPTDPARTVLNIEEARAWYWGGEVRVSKAVLDRHRLTAGVEWRDDLALQLYNHDADPFLEHLDAREEADNIGLYLQTDIVLRTNVVLTLGGRIDHFESFGNQPSARAGLVWKVWEKSNLKALFGQGYRAPNIYELSYSDDYYVGNPDLGPERVTSSEVTWSQQVGRWHRLEGCLFYNRLDDLSRQVEEIQAGSSVWIFRNQDRAEIWGGEAQWEAQWPSGFLVRASYTFAHATDVETGEWLANSPRHLLQAMGRAPIQRDRLFANLEVQGLSERRTSRGGLVSGYVLVNTSLLWRNPLPRLEVSAGIYNLLDSDYGDPVGVDFLQDAIEQDGRTYRVHLMYRF